MEVDQIIQGDCLAVLPQLPDHSIDMILCDLPYGKTAATWDKLLPMDVLWREYKRLVKPRGAIVLTAVQPFTSLLVTSNLRWYRHAWVWMKGSGIGIGAKYQPIVITEDVLVFGQGGVSYHPQKTRLPKPRYGAGPSSSVLFQSDRFQQPKRLYVDAFPKNLLDIPVGRSSHIHPTQKPVGLFDYLIRTYTQPGQLVLDHCAGSMTTAVAAIGCGRHFICIEQDETYYTKGLRRVQHAQRGLWEQASWQNRPV